MRRVVALFATLGLALLAVPVSASVTLQSVDLAGAQTIAEAMLAVPQVGAELPDGSTVVLHLGPQTYWGTVAGGAITMATGTTADPTLEVTLSDDAARAILNAYNRVNTVKLILRGGYAGISGSDRVNAGAHAIESGAFDSQLSAEAPAAGDAIRFQNEKGTLRPHGSAFAVKLGERDYMVDTLGGVIADLGPSAFHQPPPGVDVIIDPTSGASYGIQPLDEGCVADDTNHLFWGYSLTACEWESLQDSGVVS